MAQLVKNPLAMQETAYNGGDSGLIPGLERSSGEGNGSPLQYSSLGRILGQYSSLGQPTDRRAWRATVHGAVMSQAQVSN